VVGDETATDDIDIGVRRLPLLDCKSRIPEESFDLPLCEALFQGRSVLGRCLVPVHDDEATAGPQQTDYLA